MVDRGVFEEFTLRAREKWLPGSFAGGGREQNQTMQLILKVLAFGKKGVVQ